LSRAKLALINWALLLCIVAAGAPSALAQVAAKPASAPIPADTHAQATERIVDSTIPDDSSVDKMLEVYSPKVRALNLVIGKLEGDLKRGGIGAGSLGNFVADALRDRAQVKLRKPVLLAITNSSGLRKNDIAAGDLRVSDIFELLPFENALVTLDLTGKQLRDFLDVVLSNRDAQSGARITYRLNDKKENEIVSVKLGSASAEQEIDPKATYTIVTIDYLVKRGGDYSVLQEAKNLQPLNLTMRDAVLDYVKTQTALGQPIRSTLDGRFRLANPTSGQTEVEQPQ
jgi:2',3'-cyclic-nucleotide 2'-phosphodiesterase (5'-nucleotidase family)